MTALDLVIRATILLLLAWAASTLLRRRAAALRALIWTTTLAALLALPVMMVAGPDWRVEVMVAEPPSTPPVDYALVITQPPTTSAIDPVRAAARTTTAMAPAAPMATAAPAQVEWWRAIAFCALGMAALLVLRLGAAHVRLARLARSAAPFADADWRHVLDEVRGRLGVRQAVSIRISDAINVPAVAGVIRPSLLLPADARDWTAEVRRAVLLHELAHVARRDALAQLASQLACAVYWYLPLVWPASRRAAALREQACDDVVIDAGVPREVYADMLLRLARGAAAGEMPAPALAMARRSHLRARVTAILDPAPRRGIGTPARVTIVAAGAGLLTALAAVTPAIVHAARVNPPAGPIVRIVRDSTGSAGVPASPGRLQQKPAPPSTDASLCPRGTESTSIQSNSRNRVPSLRIELRGDDCRIDLRSEGRLEFTPDFADIRAITPDGFFRLDATEAGTRRQLEIESGNGTLSRTWRVDGKEQPWDASARAWFATFLIALDRRTAIGVDVRLPYLLQQGGVAAVLDETARMPEDYARGRSYEALARTTTLSEADVTRVLQQAASLSESDYYAHLVLSAFARRGVTGAAREAALQIVDRMQSDYYRAESIEVLVGAGAPDPGDVDLLVRMVPRMESDHYRTEALRHVVRAGALTPEHQAMLARVASSIESDHYLTEFLKTLAAAGVAADVVQGAILDTAAGLDSDHYLAESLRMLLRQMREARPDVARVLKLTSSLESDHYRENVLAALLAVPSLTEADLLGIVAAAAPMGDHYESETLRGILRHPASSDRVRTAVLEAASHLSRHYAEAVRRAR